MRHEKFLSVKKLTGKLLNCPDRYRSSGIRTGSMEMQVIYVGWKTKTEVAEMQVGLGLLICIFAEVGKCKYYLCENCGIFIHLKIII